MRRSVLFAALCAFSVPAYSQEKSASIEKGQGLFATYCVQCHGPNLEGGTAKGLIKDDWLFGRTRRAMRLNIAYGIESAGMPAWGHAIPRKDIEALIDFINSKQGTPPVKSKPIPALLETELYSLKIEKMATNGLRTPWGIEFVDEHRALISERPGGLRWLVDGKLDPQAISGLPLSYEFGDGGMMDLALDPKYDENGWVYIGYSEPMGDPEKRETKAMTKLIRGKVDGFRWVEQETLFEVPESEYFSSIFRFGCRLFFDDQGYLYFSYGDRGHQEDAQNLSKPSGKVYRIWPDGSIPDDNPFVDVEGAYAGIYTYGNRNAQGIAQHPETGEIWMAEHGPMGGDELNVVRKGANYGWPLLSDGLDYDGTPVSPYKSLPGMLDPVLNWTPSIAVCPIEFANSPLFPKWKNDLMVGALAFQELRRLRIENGEVVSQEICLQGFGRVRDVKFGPDGALYVVLNQPDLVLRLTPAQ